MKGKKVDEQEMAELVEEALEKTPTEQVTELTNDLQRTRADFENYRKQVEAQRLQAMSSAKYTTVEKFLPLLDDIDRAIGVYTEQLSPLNKSLARTLKELKLEKINSEPGVEFNPDFHEAVSVEDEGGDHEVIAETLRPGYLYEGNVVRAAMVKVKRIITPEPTPEVAPEA